MTEVSGFAQACFEPAFAVRVDPEFPADGQWPAPVHAFDREGRVQSDLVSRWGAPRIVQVQPAGSPEWVGFFPAGGLGGVSGVHATPSACRLCVLVEGQAYVVRVDAPAEGAVVSQGVQQVVPVAEPPLLLLVRGKDIVALGLEGVAWRSPRLARDGLRIAGVDKGGIRCTGDDLLTGEPASMVVHPATGEVTTGPGLEGLSWNPTSPTAS